MPWLNETPAGTLPLEHPPVSGKLRDIWSVDFMASLPKWGLHNNLIQWGTFIYAAGIPWNAEALFGWVTTIADFLTAVSGK